MTDYNQVITAFVADSSVKGILCETHGRSPPTPKLRFRFSQRMGILLNRCTEDFIKPSTLRRRVQSIRARLLIVIITLDLTGIEESQL